jgi:hypothetical protein
VGSSRGKGLAFIAERVQRPIGGAQFQNDAAGMIIDSRGTSA